MGGIKVWTVLINGTPSIMSDKGWPDFICAVS